MGKHERIQLTGKQLKRSLIAAGGAWTLGDLERACKTPSALFHKMQQSLAFPPPLQIVNRHLLYAGNDIAEFLEMKGKAAFARRLRMEITQMQRLGP